MMLLPSPAKIPSESPVDDTPLPSAEQPLIVDDVPPTMPLRPFDDAVHAKTTQTLLAAQPLSVQWSTFHRPVVPRLHWILSVESCCGPSRTGAIHPLLLTGINYS